MIEIKDILGVFTNCDPDDVPKEYASVLKNLRPNNGRLEKTFGSQPLSELVDIDIQHVKISGVEYGVENLYCYIDEHLATEEYRYLLIAVHPDTNEIRLFWWDYYNAVTADVTDCLALDDNTHWIKTAVTHRMKTDDKILIQDIDPATPSAEGFFDTVFPTSIPDDDGDEISQSEIFTGNAGVLDDPYWAEQESEMLGTPIAGGKVSTVKKIHDFATNENHVKDVATLLAGDIPVPIVGVGNNGGNDEDLYYKHPSTGWGSVTLPTFTYDANSLEVVKCFNHNNGEYVYVGLRYTVSGGTSTYRRLIKIEWNSTDILVTDVYEYATHGTSGLTILEYGVGEILVLFHGYEESDLALMRFNVDTDARRDESLPSIAGTWWQCDTIASVKIDSTTYYFMGYYDLTVPDVKIMYTTNFGTWTEVTNVSVPVQANYVNYRVKFMTNGDFGEDRGGSIAFCVSSQAVTNPGANPKYDVIYRTEHETGSSDVVDGYVVMDSDLPTESWNQGGYEIRGNCIGLYKAENDPSSQDKIYVYYNYYTKNMTPPFIQSGKIIQINCDNGAKNTIFDLGDTGYKGLYPSGYDDIYLPTGHLLYARSYMVLFGTYDPTEWADLWRVVDLHWKNAPAWGGSGQNTGDCEYAWRDLYTMYGMEDYFHKPEKNPVLTTDGILRLLPGNIGEVGLNRSEGVWLGYIDRQFFNRRYHPTPKYYTYPTRVVTDEDNGIYWRHGTDPFFTLGTGNGIPAQESRYYKYCFIYDGVQRALMSSPIRVYNDHATDPKTPTFMLVADTRHFNNRITEVEMYRADTIDGDYQRILNIPLYKTNFEELADNEDEITTYTGTCSDDIVWVQGQGDTDFADGNPSWIGDDWTWHIHKGSGSTGNWGNYVASPQQADPWDLPVSGDAINIDGWTSDGHELGDLWDDEVNLRLYEIWFYGHVLYKNHDHAITHHGRNVVNIGTVVGDGDLVGRWVTYNNITRQIIANQNKYILVNEAFPANVVDGEFVIHDNPAFLQIDENFLNPYRVFQIWFKDEALEVLGPHPLAGEVSIDVNGRFAKVMNGRLWQLDVMLDPGRVNEHHGGWLSYSELDQYDVNPVSNVIRFPDREGGDGTGLAEIFGKLVIMKKNGLFLLNCPAHLDPTDWIITESIHNIGNIAPHGSVGAFGKVYVVYHDGIYALSPNNIAETDSTPTEHLKITGAIQDVFDVITDKTAIVAEYNQYKDEIVYQFGTSEWAFNVATGEWREIDTGEGNSIMTINEDAHLIVYNDSDHWVKSYSEDGSVDVELKTKKFTIENRGVLWTTSVRYKSDTALTLTLYDQETSIATATLPSNTQVETKEVVFRKSLNDVQIGVDSASSTGETEIHLIRIEPGFTRKRKY